MAYDYNKRNWEQELAEAQRRQREAESAVNNYGQFGYSRQADYDSALDKVLNRKAFTYDMNSDALYKQYKDQYAALGKLAMRDTMGQAAAMTGGYGNSYAQSAGQQMYQQYMQKANDMLPQLYGMALDRYNAEGDALRQNLSMLQSDRDSQYGMWNDAYSRLLADRDYAGNQYNSLYGSAYEAARAQRADEQWQAQMDYQKARDAVADSQWERQFALSQQAARRSGGGGGGGRGKSPAKSKVTTNMKDEAWDAFFKNGQNGLDYIKSRYDLTDDDMLVLYDYIDAMSNMSVRYGDPLKKNTRQTK